MRHVCGDCAKLGKEELAYRQAVRDIDQLLDWSGLVRRKRRAAFERFLVHPDARVRLYAEEVARADETSRTAMRVDREADERALEAECEPACLYWDGEEGELAPEWVTQTLPIDPALDELVPAWEEVETPEAAIEDTVPAPMLRSTMTRQEMGLSRALEPGQARGGEPGSGAVACQTGIEVQPLKQHSR
jgi:hypothetical protein